MVTRFSATGQAYTRVNTLGVQANYTFAAWTKITVNRAADSCFMSTYLDGSNFGLFMARLGLTTSFVDEFTAFDMSAMTVGVWYYQAVAVTANVGTLLRKQEGSTTHTATSWTAAAGFTSSVTATTFAIGTDPFNNWMNGCVTGVKWWTAALTEAEMLRESWQLMPIRRANIAGAYPLIRPETTDYSGLGRTLTGGTGATFEASGPGGVQLYLPAGYSGRSARIQRANDW